MPARSIADVARSKVVGYIVAAATRSREYMVGSPFLAEWTTANVTAPACLLPDLLAALR
jgi:hypothetical protein